MNSLNAMHKPYASEQAVENIGLYMRAKKNRVHTF